MNIKQTDDLTHENEVIVDIYVDKKEKVKVHKIYIDGNEVLSDRKIKWAMKKTNERVICFICSERKSLSKRIIRTIKI